MHRPIRTALLILALAACQQAASPSPLPAPVPAPAPLPGSVATNLGDLNVAGVLGVAGSSTLSGGATIAGPGLTVATGGAAITGGEVVNGGATLNGVTNVQTFNASGTSTLAGVTATSLSTSAARLTFGGADYVTVSGDPSTGGGLAAPVGSWAFDGTSTSPGNIWHKTASGNTAWALFSSGGGGGVTSAVAGAGVTVSAATGPVTFGTDATYLQRRLGSCAASNVMTGAAQDGTPTCVPTPVVDTTDVYDAVRDCGLDPTGAADSRAALVTCITTAAAHQVATGRTTVIYFQGGTYIFTKTPAHIYTAQLANVANLAFVGPRGGLRAKLRKQGDAGAGEWRLFDVNSSAQHIYFDGLVMDGGGVTNPDPSQQDHLINIGASTSGVTDVVVRYCEFYNTIGDAVRLLGEFGSWTSQVTIEHSRFINCGRASISFQRFVRRVSVVDNYFSGGVDQQVDFEPTGYALVATTGGASSNTVLVCAGGGAGANTCQFTTWGFQPGDIIFNRTTMDLVYIVSVDSQTQITTTPLSGAATWSAATFAIVNVSDVLVDHNMFDYRHDTSGVEICLSIKDEQRVQISNNMLIDCSIGGIDANWMNISNNTIYTGGRGGAEPAIAISGMSAGNRIANNVITVRQLNGNSTLKDGIYIAIDTPLAPAYAIVDGNTVREEAQGVGIDVQDVTRLLSIRNNTITKANSGNTGQPTAINVRATNVDLANVLISGNATNIEANTAQGVKWTNCLAISAAPHNVTTATVDGNQFDGCTNGINLAETAPGVFTNAPVIGANTVNASTPLGMPTSHPWAQIGGVGGSAVTTGLGSVILTGTQDPNSNGPGGTKPKGPRGSFYLREDAGGGVGTRVYVNQDGASSWTAMAGV